MSYILVSDAIIYLLVIARLFQDHISLLKRAEACMGAPLHHVVLNIVGQRNRST